MQNFTALLLNLDRDRDRFDHMTKQLAHAGITFTRQPGILGDAVPEELKPYFFDKQGHPRTGMKRGEIGCYASHLRALQRVANDELGPAVLIMEDDLAFVPGFRDLLSTVLDNAPRGWDIIRLSNPPRRAYVPLVPIDPEHIFIRYSKIPNSAGAYLVTPAGAKKFLLYGVRGLTFDDDLRRPWFHGMETLGVMPPPARAGMLASSIDAIESGRFDKGISSRMERILRGDHFHMFRRLGYNMHNLGTENWFKCCAINLADMLIKPIKKHSIIDEAAAKFFSTKI